MKFLRPSLRFSLRAILLVVAAMACFLGWRLWDFEKATVLAIERDGGTVYFHYQNPTVTNFWLTGLEPPQFIHLDYVQLAASPRTSPPPPTLGEIVRGNYIATHAAAVDLPFEKMTPEMVTRLKSLPDLMAIVVRVNNGVSLDQDSAEATLLDTLRKEFSEKLHPTYATK
jgi:hypothetical protein